MIILRHGTVRERLKRKGFRLVRTRGGALVWTHGGTGEGTNLRLVGSGSVIPFPSYGSEESSEHLHQERDRSED